MGGGIWTGMGTLGDFAGPGGYRGGSSDSGPGWIATLVMVAPVALKLMSRGKPCDSERICKIQSGVGVEGREKAVGTRGSRAHQRTTLHGPGCAVRFRHR